MVNIPYFCGFAFSTLSHIMLNDILSIPVPKRKKKVGRVTGDPHARHQIYLQSSQDKSCILHISVHYEQSSGFQCDHQQYEKLTVCEPEGLYSTSRFTHSIYLYTT